MRFYSIYTGHGAYLDLSDRTSLVFGLEPAALTTNRALARRTYRGVKDHVNRYNPDSSRQRIKLMTWELDLVRVEKD
jgi:hypothetical protein